MLLGAHLSVEGSIEGGIRRAEKMGLTAVSFFTGSPKSTNRVSHKKYIKS